jgi:hypothetical protein
MALKALDQRLASNKSTNANSPPDPSNLTNVTSPVNRATTVIPSPAQPISAATKSISIHIMPFDAF